MLTDILSFELISFFPQNCGLVNFVICDGFETYVLIILRVFGFYFRIIRLRYVNVVMLDVQFCGCLLFRSFFLQVQYVSAKCQSPKHQF